VFCFTVSFGGVISLFLGVSFLGVFQSLYDYAKRFIRSCQNHHIRHIGTHRRTGKK